MVHTRVNVSSSEGKFAVLAKNVEYSHSCRSDNILDGLNMTVAESSIYGLTGSSGCGKTTLISCILGLRSLKSGEISVLGCNNNRARQSNPGKDIGYMPQEISLYRKFTVLEILTFFGRVHGMSMVKLLESVEQLLELTQLESKRGARIESLSGGQQRRVSLMISLVHSPKLIILDEPTVGMDALLRLRIWNHLQFLVHSKAVTVVITTHYIEEMRMADMIGIMTGGKIITENTPANLISLSHADCLNDAVLVIRKNPQLLLTSGTDTNDSLDHNWNNKFDSKKTPFTETSHTDTPETGAKFSFSTIMRVSVVKTLAWKHWILLLRNIPFLLFLTVVPFLQLLSSLYGGGTLTGLKLGVVNDELLFSNGTDPDNLKAMTHICQDVTAIQPEIRCKEQLLSCVYLNKISTEKMSLIYYATKEEATEAVHKGETYGYLHFSEVFSPSLVSRVGSGSSPGMEMDMASLVGSHITTRLDVSNTIIYSFVQMEVNKAQEKFLLSAFETCAGNKAAGALPLEFGAPIFGDENIFSLGLYAGFGLSLMAMFSYGIISSGIPFQDERNSGMLCRLQMSGVKFSEVVIAHYVSGSLLVLVQDVLVIALILWWQPTPHLSLFRVFYVFILIALSGYTGLSLGFLMGILLPEQSALAIITLAICFPLLILSGSAWPIEGMPNLVGTATKFLPFTLPVESLRWSWSRGVDFTHPNVWPGIFVFLCYIIGFNIIIVGITIYKK